MSETPTPGAVIAAARQCLGTPFRHQGRLLSFGLDCAGVSGWGALREVLGITDVIEVIEGDKPTTLLPADEFEVAFEFAFASRAIGRQAVDLKMDPAAFRRELADCRTFGFLHEVEALRAMGLARGGSMDNAVVIDGDEIMNPEGLRRPDEFVRHKALDAIGDLYVLGAPVLGRFEGVLAGHGLNNALVRALLATPHAWRLRTLSPETLAPELAADVSPLLCPPSLRPGPGVG